MQRKTLYGAKVKSLWQWKVKHPKAHNKLRMFMRNRNWMGMGAEDLWINESLSLHGEYFAQSEWSLHGYVESGNKFWSLCLLCLFRYLFCFFICIRH